MNLLIVEDQKWTLRTLAYAVDTVMPNVYPEYTPAQREVAKCYAEAVAALNSKTYDIILLDHRMPLENVGTLEDRDFDAFSASLHDIGYTLIPRIQEKNPKSLIIGTSSLSREERGNVPSPLFTMSKMPGEAERDLEALLRKRNE